MLPSEIKNKTWGSISYACFCDTVNDVYDEIVHYRRNLFNVPSGRAGKGFIEELTFWIKQFNSGSDLISVALKLSIHGAPNSDFAKTIRYFQMQGA